MSTKNKENNNESNTRRKQRVPHNKFKEDIALITKILITSATVCKESAR
jgi:hypothetical protein